MIKKIKKPVSILLALLMAVSMFTAVPMTATAADYSYGSYVYASDLQIGDTIGLGTDAFYANLNIILRGGTYCRGFIAGSGKSAGLFSFIDQEAGTLMREPAAVLSKLICRLCVWEYCYFKIAVLCPQLIDKAFFL